MNKERKLSSILWNIALPGFAQVLQKRYIIGFVLVFMEIIINIFSRFNEAIRYSFLGQIDKAISVTNYQFLMFYPCLYMFALWDAFYEADQGETPYAFLPFVFGAYFITVGLIFAERIKIFGVLLGPVWLPILSLIPGLFVGLVIRKVILTFSKSKSKRR
ncbi:hypothetical protein SAMN05421676_11164 [Salinibacillus kushneri]|uniref:Uncharacterized protein n=1 Tax=Salinibacillus kushneri TaxID=237682 RepID=A0A1I0IBC2_9BACI|nr:hypothetical protein [Salinibacillus kushneri]SET93347.1 hypothetical protein SAMN05421676_11164 [Salinibacillus kushneri]